ncbi:MAG: 1-deoxy-D-xylulose-5-phosphate synthase, partial [Candidatus Coatesbacteria bacterium]|nr:1-deoxy-D-xylulose-5-phosphate synthase [Candidatus Coatesbacteria bacterium]
LMHDVALDNLHVVFCIDRAGIVGDDGPTHNGTFDLSFLLPIPNMVVMAPKDENELQHMLKTAIEYEGPAALRYPRGKALGVPLDEKLETLEIGKSELLRSGSDLAIFAIGTMVNPSLEAAEILSRDNGIEAAVINARFAKPIDVDMLVKWAKKTKRIITVEENALSGGFGSAVLSALSDNQLHSVAVRRLGIGDFFVEHGAADSVRADLGLDAAGIAHSAAEFLSDARPKTKKTKNR